MADKAQLIAQIRFALEQLSERNAEHEWEHLCRHLARERICSNILPATGPVQSGGDQGRDFETFRTYLVRSPLGGRSFVGLISDKPIAFACTLEKEKTLASKVRNDVATIMSSGTPVKGIHVFCSRGLPVSKRHKLQEWALTTHGVELEILDGEAVAELLCDREIFSLAERYLQLPTELLPSLPSNAEKKDWYAGKLEKWRQQTRQAQTFADFTEIRSAARTALGPFAYAEDGRPINRHELPELPYWIDRLDEIADHGVPDSLRRRAFYEASVLRLRGLDSLVGQEKRLRLYFARIPQLGDPAEIEDAQVLLSYVLPARRLKQVQLEESEVTAWFRAMEDRLDDRLQEAEKSNRVNDCCALLEVRGHAALIRRVGEGKMDPAEALRYWNKLATLVSRAPLFPLERFADRLAEYVRFIGAHPDYEPLTRAVDGLLAKRFGQFKAAENCLDRAKAFIEAGDLPRAMAQLHRAKIDWFAEETLGKALLALNCLSAAYSEQGLWFAAKYYALAAAYSGINARDLRLKPISVRAIERAAACDYALGAWHGFLELAEAFAIFYPHFAADPTADFNNPDGVLQHFMFHLTALLAVTKLLKPDLEPFSNQRCLRIAQRLGLADALESTRSYANETWATMKTRDLWGTIEGQLPGPPWSDAGSVRRAQWKAHGVTWRAQWANGHETTLAAEEFLAALQVFLSDLAGYDLCLLRTTLNISLCLADDAERGQLRDDSYKGFGVRFDPSNAERFAVVNLPPYRDFRDGALSRQDLLVGALSVASQLLAEVSMLPRSRFAQVLDDRFAQGLQSKLLIAAPYGRCSREFVGREVFDDSARAAHTPLTPPKAFECRLLDKLPWFDGLGPGYQPEEVKAHLHHRYEAFACPIGRTLARLRQEPRFQATLARLRASGWKDWHILSALFHVTMNYRLNQRRIVLPNQLAEMAADQRLLTEPEAEDAVQAPLEEYDEEKLRQHVRMYMGAFTKTFGLEIHQLTPDLPAIEDFLARRYNFWSDDVDHDDLFKL